MTTLVPYLSTILVLAHLVAAGVTVLLAVYIRRHHWDKQIGRVFGLLVLTFSIWILGSLGRFSTVDPGIYVAITTVKYVGITTAPVLFFLFGLLYAGRHEWVTSRVVVTLLALPAATLIVLATTVRHGLFYRAFSVTTIGQTPILETAPGPWFWLFAVFGWGLLVLGSGLIIYTAFSLPRLYQAQTAVVMVAIGIAWAVNLAYVFFDWPHPALDPTPFGFALTCLLLAVGLFSTQLLDIVPAARSYVLDAIDDAVIVLDPQGRIVDVNAAAHRLLGQDHPVGLPAHEVLPGDLNRAIDEGTATVALPVDDTVNRYRLRRLPIGPDGTHGVVMVLTDLTEQLAIQEALERQNERLDAFASMVSHDLRNPLNVAAGRLELARESGDSEDLQTVAHAHERMEQLIEDLLALAREGTPVDAVEPVELASVAREGWSNVATGEAALIVETHRRVEADRNRLQQLFENLFRNAVEHGGRPVTVTVGEVNDGFYIEDDGIGIQPATRERVFEVGYSTDETSTGFGLAIVREIVDAHGWSVHVTDGSQGGARFEITNVTFIGS